MVFSMGDAMFRILIWLFEIQDVVRLFRCNPRLKEPSILNVNWLKVVLLTFVPARTVSRSGGRGPATLLTGRSRPGHLRTPNHQCYHSDVISLGKTFAYLYGVIPVYFRLLSAFLRAPGIIFWSKSPMNSQHFNLGNKIALGAISQTKPEDFTGRSQ